MEAFIRFWLMGLPFDQEETDRATRAIMRWLSKFNRGAKHEHVRS